MADPAQSEFWNVPNTITMSRLVLAVAVFALIAYQFYGAALVVFTVAALTDALDGYLARRLNQATPIGRQLDPLVDKVIVSGGFIYLLAIPESGLAPWMVTAIIIREFLIQGLRTFLENHGQAFGAQWAGKVKTTFQCLAIAAILLSLAVRPGQPWLWIRDGLTWVAVVLTLYSGISYLATGLPRLHSTAASSGAS